MLEHSPIVAPVIALAIWTHVMWAWMYVTRVPAIISSKMVMNPEAPRGEQMATLPATVRWKADNYNHLLEQPTVFYAVALSLAVLGAGNGLNATLAWSYVGIRIIHSLLQALINKIEVRFILFILSSLILIALTINAARIAFQTHVDRNRIRAESDDEASGVASPRCPQRADTGSSQNSGFPQR